MRSTRAAALLVFFSTISLACISESEAGPKVPKAPPNTTPIRLRVDVRDAARRTMHSAMVIPVEPGPLTLQYPKWIPGEHGPTGAITGLAGIVMRANGKTLAWTRDAVEMYAFHVDVPEGAKTLEVELDYVAPSASENEANAPFSTPELADVTWHNSLFYPAGRAASDWTFEAVLLTPKGWKVATALPVASKTDGEARFAPVSLVTLIDSPVIVGANLTDASIGPSSDATPHALHVVGDSPASVVVPKPIVEDFSALVRETLALTGARHYRRYDFLLTLSDHLPADGLEHHESSDNRLPERALLDPSIWKSEGNLFAHEMFHSWNGKYRRPVGLATPDYQAPMKGELLWIYEGLTEYYGNVLATRAGFWSEEEFREDLAHRAALLDNTPGRTWQPLSDVAVAAQVLYNVPEEGTSWRRGTDFYSEGELIWLEVDTTLRKLTNGARSLDDFCKAFFGGASGKPEVKPYTLEDVVKALDAVAKNDWKKLLDERVTSKAPSAPLGGIALAGYRLAFSDAPNEGEKNHEEAYKTNDYTFSLGFRAREEKVLEVVVGSAAHKAGLAAGMKLVAVNSRKYKPELIADALLVSKASAAPIELLVENQERFSTVKVDYHGGPRAPHLERDASKPDVLAAILAARAPSTAERRKEEKSP